MSRFAIRMPYLIVVVCLLVAILGAVCVKDMPVDMFPPMNIPVVAVATFFSGMPPEQIESDITYHYERMFTLASGIDHIESRSLPGVSLIKVYFHSDTNADADAAAISTLAMADLKNLPPGTYPPIVLKTDPSSLPVCLVTLRGADLNESTLKDLGQNFVRNQLASVSGSSVPQPFGGRWRQIMLYADPLKLEANQLSLMDVVRSINDANTILPAGDVQLGRYDYNIYTNALLSGPKEVETVPLKMVGQSPVRAGDIGTAQDRGPSTYLFSNRVETPTRFPSSAAFGTRSPNYLTSPTRYVPTWFSINRDSSRRQSKRCFTKAVLVCSSPVS